MDVGIGLPGALAPADPDTVLEWARRADAGPFSTFGMTDRIVWPGYEVMATFAVVAGVTSRVRLMPTVLISPLRDTPILAKQAATIDALSGGRLSIGFGVGARDDDYRATERPFHRRGRRLNQQLEDLKRIWSGGDINGVGPIGPNPAQEGGLPLFIGGYGEEMARRVARWGNGYISGSGGPERAGSAYKLAEAAWQRANRSGRPRFVACSYFALGEGAEEQVRTAIGAYYGERGRGIIGLTPTTEQGVRDVIAQFRDIGADELILWPAGGNVEQVDRLAQLAG